MKKLVTKKQLKINLSKYLREVIKKKSGNKIIKKKSIKKIKKKSKLKQKLIIKYGHFEIQNKCKI